MYRPKPSKPPPPIRLEPLSGMPSYEHLLSLFKQAESLRNRSFELPIVLTDANQFLLSASCASDNSEFLWGLHVGTGPRNEQGLLWQHATNDLHFILNLTVGSLTGGNVAEAIAQGSIADASTMRLGMTTGDLNITNSSMAPAVTAQSQQTGATFEGDLINMQVPGLLQSIALNKMTGLLTLTSDKTSGRIFFDEGVPVHATTYEVKGDAAIMELLTWEKGTFRFTQSERSTERTVRRRLDALLVEGVTLLDQTKFLNSAGLTMDSYLIKKSPNLSEGEFEQMVARGAPIDLGIQKRFYLQIDSETTLFEILRQRPMIKQEWAPILYNLISCGMLIVSDRPAQVSKKVQIVEGSVDRAAIAGAIKTLTRAETEIFSYPYMLYFLEQEFARFEAGGSPFSVILFEMVYGRASGFQTLPVEAVRDAGKRIATIKRRIDLLGHYETLAYMLLLPQTDLQGAGLVASRLLEVMKQTTIKDQVDSQSLFLAAGVGCVPADCNSMGTLLMGTNAAKERSKVVGSPIVLLNHLS